MNNQSEMFEDIKPQGSLVKAWCKCGHECECLIKVFADGTRHAWGTCPNCGKTNAKQQRLPPTLEELKHILMGVFSKVSAMPKNVDKDEAVAMIERLADDLRRQI